MDRLKASRHTIEYTIPALATPIPVHSSIIMSGTSSTSIAASAIAPGSATPPSVGSMENTLRGAVRLLQALDALPSYVPSIGHVVVPNEWKEYPYDDNYEKEEEEEEESSRINEDMEDSSENENENGNEKAKKSSGEDEGLTPEQQALEFRTLLNSSACLKALNSVPSVVTAGALSCMNHPPSNMMGTKQSSNGAVDIKANDVERTGKEDAYAHNAVIADGMDQIKLHFDNATGSGNSMNSNVIDSSIHYEGSLLSIPDEIFTSLWQSAPVSPFGHVASQETLIDPSVRHARELIAPSNLSVNPFLLNHLAQLWSKYMLPRRVRVETYKLNIYGPGGHFAPHRDTPAPGLVGTILIGLVDTSDQNSGLRIWTNQHKHIDESEPNAHVNDVSNSPNAGVEAGAAAAAVINVTTRGGGNVDVEVDVNEDKEVDASVNKDADIDEDEDVAEDFNEDEGIEADANADVNKNADADADVCSSSMIWRSTAGSICMFYPDLTHAVLPITSGYRATIAFKVFIDESIESSNELSHQADSSSSVDHSSGSDSQINNKTLSALRRCVTNTPFGLLLHHFYTQEASVEALRGSDALIYRWLQSIGSGLELTVIPVLVRVDEQGPLSDEDYEYDDGEYFSTPEYGYRVSPNGIFPTSENIIQFVLKQIPQTIPKIQRYREFIDYYTKRKAVVPLPVESLPIIPGIDWKSPSLPFFALSKFMDSTKKLGCTLHSHGGHGGNEANPSSAESIYLHRAIIVRRKQ
jgi:hypothetical protein